MLNIKTCMPSCTQLVLQYLDNLRQSVHDNLKQLVTSPSVEMQDIPPDLLSLENTEEQDPDIRNHQEDIDKRLVFLFDLILYVPSKIFQLYRGGSSWVEPVLS